MAPIETTYRPARVTLRNLTDTAHTAGMRTGLDPKQEGNSPNRVRGDDPLLGLGSIPRIGPARPSSDSGQPIDIGRRFRHRTK